MATQISNQFLTLADGNRMPQEGFGLYKITDEKEAVNAIKWAYETGYRLFDTAQMYENEEFVGEGLRQLSAPRESYFVTTKVSEANQGYDQTKQSVVSSLKKLGLDYVDLLLIHWPVHQHFFETWRAFEDLKAEGLVRSIGVSNYGMVHLEYLATKAREMPVLDQLEVHPWLTEKPMLKFNAEHNIITQAWSPLGRGKRLDDPVLLKLAATHGKTPAQIILRWHLQNGIAIIPKSVHQDRIKANADIFDFELSPAEMQQIDGLNTNHRISKEPEMVYEFGYQYPY
ncbi:aldo/keto reductase [Limosilactobacillus mucosae]|uniref:aldo/keto reductase n=1 Tax=Limosilactobacillus mucosae TaxID=97478 RepID=UPI00299FC37B|nr:aldo/keto reductase [Limosilactobacillus mucosae]MDX2310810.1 aldo/keto reductase [Limosilactobacillus mucosae]